MPRMCLDNITIPARFRSSDGDISELAESIRTVGLLHPIVVTKDGSLIAGKRRLEACRSLGWTEIPVTVADPQDMRRAEADENRVRLDFSPSDMVAVAAYFEAEEKAKARERKVEGAKHKGCGKFPQASEGKTRDALAARVGTSGRTLEKAKAVVEAAEKEPERFAAVLVEMDETGKIDPAYRKVREAEERQEKKEERRRLWENRYLDAAKEAYLRLEKKDRARFRAWLRTPEAKVEND